MDTITLSLLIILFSLFIYLFAVPYKKNKRIAKYLAKIPGPYHYPIIGSAYLYIGLKREDLKEYMEEKMHPIYGPIYKTWVVNLPLVHILKPDDFETILTSTSQITKSSQYDALKPWLGDGLILASGEKWRRNRKLLTPTFHFKVLESFVDVFNEKAEILTKKLNEYADGKTVIDIYNHIAYCALDIIGETAMGTKIGALENKNTSSYVRSIYRISELCLRRMFRPWLKNSVIYNLTKDGQKFSEDLATVHGFANEVIKKRQQQYATKSQMLQGTNDIGEKRRLAFLDHILTISENGKLLNNKEIRHEVDTIMFAGHDTTSNSIVWTLLLLANHLDIQEKVRAEINSIFINDKLSKTDLKELKYLERVIKESLRLFPPAPTIGRHITEDITLGEYILPKGANIILYIFDMHRNPLYFPDPLKFDPDRFLPENCLQRHPFCYVPFSAGPRNCLGQKFAIDEEKVLLAHILKKFRIKTDQDYKTVKVYKEIVLKPQKGLPITLERL